MPFKPENLKRWLTVLATALALAAGLFFIAGTTTAWAIAEDPLTKKERAWLQAHPDIKLAPDPKFLPIEHFRANGRSADERAG